MDDGIKSDGELQAEESQYADKSLFVQELLLALLATDETSCGGGEMTADVRSTGTTTIDTQQQAEDQPKLASGSTVDSAVAAAIPVSQPALVGPHQRAAASHDNPTAPVERGVTNMGPRSGGRGSVAMTTMASSVPADSSRMNSMSNMSAAPRNLTKRSKAPVAVAGLAARPSKDTANTNTVKRH